MVSQINKIILKSLETGDKYGLEIIKDIQAFTNNRVILKQPSLYSALRRMEKKGLISSFWEDSELGGRRHYYSLTRSGREELQADSVVSESDIQSILYEVNKSFQNGVSKEIVDAIPEPVIKNKVSFERFDPSSEQTSGKSFTQQVRREAEPATIQEKIPASTTQPANIEIVPKSNNQNQTSFWRESMIQENEQESNRSSNALEFKFNEEKPNKFEINYKDILGDLDADKTTEKPDYSTAPTLVQNNSNDLTTKQEQQQKAKEYSSQFSQLFTSNKSQPEKTTITKEQEELRNAIFRKQNQNTLDEISRRYNLKTDVTSQQSDARNKTFLEVNDYSNLTKVSPNEIEVKQYVHDNNVITSDKKEFININKLVLTRSIIMSFFFAISVLISYFVFNEQNFIYAPHISLYWIALGAVVLYICIVLAITLPNLHKKIQLSKINWFVNLFYRVLIAVALYTLVIATCLCFGMTNFAQIEFFTIWYIPTLAIGGILISWVVSYIIYSTKAFRE